MKESQVVEEEEEEEEEEVLKNKSTGLTQGQETVQEAGVSYPTDLMENPNQDN
ncbi:hypothetical protein chiPu_0027250, partial [Chiloscyllium punctatum]|nr:hypothetical protein [Chiloscyllium punctatum]